MEVKLETCTWTNYQTLEELIFSHLICICSWYWIEFEWNGMSVHWAVCNNSRVILDLVSVCVKPKIGFLSDLMGTNIFIYKLCSEIDSLQLILIFFTGIDQPWLSIVIGSYGNCIWTGNLVVFLMSFIYNFIS